MADQPLTPEWKKLMRLVERLGFGEVKVHVKNGRPYRVEIAIKSVMLDSPDDSSIDDVIVSIGE